MIHEQNNIKYKIKDGVLKGWIGKSEFNRPFWDGEKIIDKPITDEEIAKQLYDALVEEGKQVFEDFRNELAKAASPYTILGNTPNELKGLTQAMLDAKKRINDALDYLLAQNDVETLKKFSFDTEESRQLKEAIESFK